VLTSLALTEVGKTQQVRFNFNACATTVRHKGGRHSWKWNWMEPTWNLLPSRPRSRLLLGFDA